METVDVQWMALLVAVIINMVVGAIWYSPVMFGKAWQKFIGKTDKQLSETAKGAYIYAVVMALVQSFVLKHFVTYATVFYPSYSNLEIGLFTGAWIWIGFVATSVGLSYIFAARRKKLLLIDAGYHLVVLMINGALLATWI